jgi:hypothetical protein
MLGKSEEEMGSGYYMPFSRKMNEKLLIKEIWKNNPRKKKL